MSQSVRLTNEMREDIARVLACRAMKRKAQRLHKDIEKFNADYWERHQSKVDKAMAPLTKKDWPALMQSGILTSTQTVIPETERETPRGERRFMGVSVSSDPEVNRVLDMAGLVCGDQRKYVLRRRSGLGLYLRAGTPMPRINHMERIDTKKMADRANRLLDRLSAIVKETRSTYQEIMGILRSCTTSRQLEDVFPEAAKLVPQPAPKQGQMVPQEQIDRVRSLIKENVT